MDRVFFTNSGTEAVDGAIKLAKKYAYLKDGSTDHEIIAMEHSFHGRSMGALAVTGNRHYQEAFGPMIPGIKFAKYNDLESVKSLVMIRHVPLSSRQFRERAAYILPKKNLSKV